MHIRFDLDFDGETWPGPLRGRGAVAGEAWVGPQGLWPGMSNPAVTAGGPMLTGPVPGLKMVKVFGGLRVPINVEPKSNDAGLIDTGGGTTPVPVSEIVREPGDTLSHTAIVPVKDPSAVGWNVAVNWHEVPGA